MSGLVRFVRSLLPDLETTETPASPAAAAEAQQLQQQPSGTPRDADAAAGTANHHVEEEQENNEEEEKEYLQSVSSIVSSSHASSSGSGFGATVSSHSATSNAQQHQQLSYEEWKAQRNEALVNYMNERIVHTQSQDEDEDHQGDEETEEDEDYTLPETEDQVWETQQQASQPTFERESFSTPPSNPKPDVKRRKKYKKPGRVPHISETNHLTTSIHQVDLYSTELSLSLCRVEHVWGFREVRRIDKSTRETTRLASSDSILSIPFGSFQDDGPFATIYKQVLSLTVTSLEPPSRAGGAQQTRLRVFLYNNYAKEVHQFLTRSANSNPTLLLELSHIPAKCIVPHQPQNSNWLDNTTHIPYCLCIGDKSSMKMDAGEGLLRVHFDSPNLTMKLSTLVGEGETAAVVELGPGSLVESEGTLFDSEQPQSATNNVLSERFRAFQQQQQQEDEPQDAATMPAASVPAPAQVQQKPSPEDTPAVIAADTTVTSKQPQNEEKAAEESTDTTAASKRSRTASTNTATTSVQPEDEEKTAEESTDATAAAKRSAPEQDSERPSGAEAGEGVEERTQHKRIKTAPLSPSASSAPIVYHKLSELRQLYDNRTKSNAIQSVNLYGAVLGFSSPSLTKANDWSVHVSLVDESLPLPVPGDQQRDDSVVSISVMIFCKERNKLPQFKMAGDILRLHRVAIQEWKDEIQVLGRRASSYVVCRPKSPEVAASENADDWEVVPTARVEFHFGADDIARCSQLWRWSQTRLATHPTMKVSTRFDLNQLARQEQSEAPMESTHGDSTVIVSAILQVPPSRKTSMMPIGYLRVWDGTGPPVSDPQPVSSQAAADWLRRGDPSRDVLISIANVIDMFKSRSGNEGTEAAESSSADTTLEAPKVLCGRVANVAVWEEPHWELITANLKAGSFIRLRNVQESRLYDGLKCLMLGSKSWLTPLPSQAYEIRKLLHDHQARVLRKEPHNPSSGLLPLADGSTTDLPPLGDGEAPMDVEVAASTPATGPTISKCISDPAPGSFKVHFFVSGIVPGVDDAGMRNLCIPSQSRNGSMDFQFALHLRDATGEIDAIVANDVGETVMGMTADAACKLAPSDAKQIVIQLIQPGNRWEGEIRSVELNGAKYFILLSPKRDSDELSYEEVAI